MILHHYFNASTENDLPVRFVSLPLVADLEVIIQLQY